MEENVRVWGGTWREGRKEGERWWGIRNKFKNKIELGQEEDEGVAGREDRRENEDEREEEKYQKEEEKEEKRRLENEGRGSRRGK